MDTKQADKHFTLARNHFRNKEDVAAAAICREILAHCPDHVATLHLLGIISLRKKDTATATDLLRQAAELEPATPMLAHDYAVALVESGEPAMALPILKKLTAAHPRHAEAHFLAGNCYSQLGRLEAAAGRFEAALRARPDFPEALFNLGITLRKLHRQQESVAAFRQLLALPGNDTAENNFELGLSLQSQKKHREAIPAYERALELAPNHANACYNLGIALREAGFPDKAIEVLKKVLRLQPSSLEQPVILCNLGLALQEADRYEEALTCFEQATTLDPNYAECFSDWGSTLVAMDRAEAALAHYQRAVAIKPQFYHAWYNMGIAYLELLDLEQAIACYRRAIALKPDLAEAHWNLAIVLLLSNRYQEGFQEYLWRWRRKQAQPFPIDRPEWRGQADDNLTLLIHTEQGLGDAIQFVRYLEPVKKRVGRVFLACQPSLFRLLQSLPWVDAIFSKQYPEKIAPLIDAHVPLLNLPTILETTAETIPADVPYIFAEQELIGAAAHLFENTTMPRIGLVWRGNPQHAGDKKRSCRIADLAPLFTLPGLAFYSLQKEHHDDLPKGLTDLAPHLESFSHTAAILHHLDLVITVDTAVAHLAGAMARPVWTLLPYVPDWRWQLSREDTPWYPSMRLFRQKRRNDWQEVFIRVVAALKEKFGADHISPP